MADTYFRLIVKKDKKPVRLTRHPAACEGPEVTLSRAVAGSPDSPWLPWLAASKADVLAAAIAAARAAPAEVKSAARVLDGRLRTAIMDQYGPDKGSLVLLLLTSASLEWEQRHTRRRGGPPRLATPAFDASGLSAAEARAAAARVAALLRRLEGKAARRAGNERVQVALALVRGAHAIVVPIIPVQGWGRLSRANRRELQVFGLGGLLPALARKAGEYGVTLYFTNESYTSKTCSCCWAQGAPNDRVKTCSMCGLRTHRDANAAACIMQLATTLGLLVRKGTGFVW